MTRLPRRNWADIKREKGVPDDYRSPLLDEIYRSIADAPTRWTTVTTTSRSRPSPAFLRRARSHVR